MGQAGLVHALSKGLPSDKSLRFYEKVNGIEDIFVSGVVWIVVLPRNQLFLGTSLIRSVSTGVGPIAFTVIFILASYLAAVFVSDSTAALLAA